MDTEWDVSEPFEYVNEEDAQFQFPEHKKPHPEWLTGNSWEEAQSGVKARLLEVVHGYAGGSDEKPRTLAVFEFVLVTGTNSTRLENVSITVGFRATGTRSGVRAGGNISDWDPVPVNWAPKAPITPSHFSRASATDTANKEGVLKVGYDPYVSASGKRAKGSTLAVRRVNYRYITSTPTWLGKNSDPVNAMEWRLVENEALQSGVQFHVRTAVLLRRKYLDYGTFDIITDIQANDSLTSKMLRVFRKILPRRRGAPTFDPLVLPGSSDGEEGDDDVAARATTRDRMNLDKVDLEEVLVKDWGVGSAEELDKLEPEPKPGSEQKPEPSAPEDSETG